MVGQSALVCLLPNPEQESEQMTSEKETIKFKVSFIFIDPKNILEIQKLDYLPLQEAESQRSGALLFHSVAQLIK